MHSALPSSADDAGRAWAGLAAVLAAGAALAMAVDGSWLAWQPALAWRQPWRAWSAAFVHFSALHLGANLAGAMLVGALGLAAHVPRRIVVAWLAAWPLTQLGLLARPDLHEYGGLSGVLHAGVACVALHLVIRGRGARRGIGAATLAVLVGKVVSESPWGAPLRHPVGWDIAVAPVAHLSGLLSGLLATAAAEVWHRHSQRSHSIPADD